MARKERGAGETRDQGSDGPWRMRIIGEDEVPPDQLLANPANFKIHGIFQKDALAGILGDIGWVQRIIVNQRTNCVLDGHARVQVALQHNEPLVPVVYVDVSEDEERLLLASLDTITGLAGTDTALLANLLQEISTPDATLMTMLSNMAQEHGIVPKETTTRLPEQTLPAQWLVLIECRDEVTQLNLLERFLTEGLSCRALQS